MKEKTNQLSKKKTSTPYLIATPASVSSFETGCSMNPTPLFEEVEADNIVVAVVVDDGDGIVNRFFPLPLLLLLQLPKRSKT
jgi:hypothetical protein